MISSHLRASVPQILCRTQENRAFHVSFSAFPIPNTLRCRDPAGVAHRNALAETTDLQKRVRIQTLNGCKLGIDKISCEYNGEGGMGMGHSIMVEDEDQNGNLAVEFNLKTLYIPPVTTETAKVFGWPFPPFFKVDIVPQVLGGKIYQESGKVELNFKADFWFHLGSSYNAPPLLVETVLTSEESKGMRYKSTRGKRLSKDGKCKLVAIAQVDATDDPHINFLLGLPSECVANLNAVISFL